MSGDALAARLLQTFLAELDDQLRALDADLVAMEAGDAGDGVRLANLFRVFHTLKGAARAAGVPRVEAVCHALESRLADVRAASRPLGADEFALLFTAVDALGDAGRRLREGEPVGDGGLAQLERALGVAGAAGGGPGLGAPITDPGLLGVLLAPSSGAPPAAPAAAPAGAPAGAAPARADDAPDGDEDDGDEGNDGERDGEGDEAAARAGDAPGGDARAGRARSSGEVPALRASDAERAAGRGGPLQLRVPAAKLDDLADATGHLATSVARASGRAAAIEAAGARLGRWAAEWRRLLPGLRATLPDEALDRLDALVRDLAVTLPRVAAAARDDERALAQAADEVGEQARRLRLRPFAEAAEALPRVARDVAASAGKEVELRVEGGDVEVDRAVLDGLREALLHLVRNAVDHGIEAPDERARAGKPRRGSVRVRAALRGGGVRVTVADDGRGLDVAAISEQLRRRGQPVPDDERDLARALFEGGFSTRAEATTFSGRGVGLDVVQTTLRRVRGAVSVAWTAGEGTTFTLEAPLSLATQRALVVLAGGQPLALPTEAVRRLLRVPLDALRLAEGRRFVTTEEGPVPVVSLARLLGPPLAERPVDGVLPVVLLETGGRRLALGVDALLDERELVVRPIERRGAGALPALAGASLLGDGRVALVLAPAAVVALGLRAAAGAASPRLGAGAAGAAGAGAGAASAPAARSRVLVVDDSITTRTLEQSVLEAAGYEVATAVDGADGWRLLQEQGADLVLSDVEMPRMDGFTLCETIRGSKRFAQLPVVLVTSLESAEHRARGLEAGADAYVVKSGFDQEALLATVRELIGREGA